MHYDGTQRQPRNLLYDLPLTSGIGRATGSADPTFARASAASYLSAAGVWTTVASGAPRVDSGGLRLAPARTNKCYANINPANTDGVVVSGGTVTVEDDSTQLAADDCGVWGDNVYKFVPGAGAETFVCGAASGGTAAHSWSFLMRGDAGGEEPDYGHADSDGANFEKRGDVPALTTSWTRYTYDGKAVDAADQYFAIQVPAGATVYIIAQQWEQGANVTDPIPNSATAATAARPVEVLTLPLSAWPIAAGEVAVTLRRRSTPTATQYQMVLTAADYGVRPLQTVTTAAGTVQVVTQDGTTQVFTGAYAARAIGDAFRVRVRWGVSGKQVISDGSYENSGAWDGSHGGVAMTMQAASDGPAYTVEDLKIYRRPR